MVSQAVTISVNSASRAGSATWSSLVSRSRWAELGPVRRLDVQPVLGGPSTVRSPPEVVRSPAYPFWPMRAWARSCAVGEWAADAGLR